MNAKLAETWKHYFKSVCYRVRLAPKEQWRYLSMDVRLEAQSTGAATHRTPCQEILEIGEHQTFMESRRTTPIRPDDVVQDLKAKLRVGASTAEDAMSGDYVGTCLRIYQKAFVHGEIMDLCFKDAERGAGDVSLIMSTNTIALLPALRMTLTGFGLTKACGINM